jgi:hypothetical protein
MLYRTWANRFRADLPYNHSQEQHYSGVQAPQLDELTRLRAENEASNASR